MKKLVLVFASVLVFVGCASAQLKQEFTLQGDHGKLAAVLQTPKHKKDYPLVIIAHGFNASKEMYLLKDLSNQLNERGIATLLFDFNGRGAGLRQGNGVVPESGGRGRRNRDEQYCRSVF